MNDDIQLQKGQIYLINYYELNLRLIKQKIRQFTLINHWMYLTLDDVFYELQNGFINLEQYINTQCFCFMSQSKLTSQQLFYYHSTKINDRQTDIIIMLIQYNGSLYLDMSLIYQRFALLNLNTHIYRVKLTFNCLKQMIDIDSFFFISIQHQTSICLSLVAIDKVIRSPELRRLLFLT